MSTKYKFTIYLISLILMGSSCKKDSNQDMLSQEEISAFVTSIDVTEKALINEKIPVSIS